MSFKEQLSGRETGQPEDSSPREKKDEVRIKD